MCCKFPTFSCLHFLCNRLSGLTCINDCQTAKTQPARWVLSKSLSVYRQDIFAYADQNQERQFPLPLYFVSATICWKKILERSSPLWVKRAESLIRLPLWLNPPSCPSHAVPSSQHEMLLQPYGQTQACETGSCLLWSKRFFIHPYFLGLILTSPDMQTETRTFADL